MQTLQIEGNLQHGKYIIKKVLGQGGFGITYLAEHTLLGIDVAIKEFFMKDFCDRDENTSLVTTGSSAIQEQINRYKEKFLKEARNIAKLRHPNIVRIQDVFEENGTAYYVMDYCEGASLADLIKNHPSGLPESVALKYIKQVASALQYMHEEKMNHLDVKPANILLDKHDNAILIDFGLAKQYDAQGGQTSTTPVGISHGYAPIEQYKDGGVREFSSQTDIYALGATLYKLVTGNTPPQAGDIINDGLPTLPFGISQSTKNAIEKAMEVRKLNRPETVASFLSMLESKANDEVTILVNNVNNQDEGTKVIDGNKSFSFNPTKEPSKLSDDQKINKDQTKKSKKKKINILAKILLIAILVLGTVSYLGYYLGLSLMEKGSNKTETNVESAKKETVDQSKANEPILHSVSIGSNPTNAEVYINGKYYGKTPFSVSLAADSYTVRLSKTGYEDWKGPLYVTTNGNNSINCSLTKSNVRNGDNESSPNNIPQKTTEKPKTNGSIEVCFGSSTKDAYIYIDDGSSGLITSKYKLSYGTHKVSVDALGYKPTVRTINVDQDNYYFYIPIEKRSDYNEVISRNTKKIITVKGRVTTKSGRPVSGRVIEIMRDGVSKSTSVFTNKDGYFTLKDIFSTDEVRVFDFKTNEYQKRQASSSLNFQVEE